MCYIQRIQFHFFCPSTRNKWNELNLNDGEKESKRQSEFFFSQYKYIYFQLHEFQNMVQSIDLSHINISTNFFFTPLPHLYFHFIVESMDTRLIFILVFLSQFPNERNDVQLKYRMKKKVIYKFLNKPQLA